MKKFVSPTFGFFLFVAISVLVILKIQNHAFLYLGLFWLAVLTIVIIRAKTEKRKFVGIYSISLVLAALLAELYFSGLLGVRYHEATFEEEIISGGRHESHDLLGQALMSNSQWTAKYTYADSIVFDVVQTIDSSGLRLTPGKVLADASPVLFLGCSFTFGAGLNDYETLPYLFQKQSSGTMRAINMAYNGYGAHQILAIIEEEMERKVLKQQKPKAAIYSAIPDHVFRGTNWYEESFGPKYVLDNRVNPKRTDTILYNPSLKFKLLSKSHLASRFLFRRDHSNAEDVNLLLAMIRRSSELFTARYTAPFYCLLWDEIGLEPKLYNTLLTRLKVMDVKVIEVKDILPDYAKHPEKYLLYGDNHPNALANQLIAEYLNKLLGK